MKNQSRSASKFEDVLEERLSKQDRWAQKFQELPLIEASSKVKLHLG